MNTQNPIFELAISNIKEGRKEDFATTRANLIAELNKTKGYKKEGNFQSFLSADKTLNPQDIQVGIIKWESEQAFGQAVQPLLPTDTFKNYLDTFDPLMFLRIQTEDGQDFDINTITKKGQVVEFTITEIKEGQEALFVEKHNVFFDKLSQSKGFIYQRGFVVPGEKTQVAITVWESMEDFQKAGEALPQLKEYVDFISLADLKGFQATQVKG